jgi:phage shock protein C
MSNPYPPYQQPRRLERSRTNRVLGGVCGGVANYVNMDPTLVRVLTVVISLFTGVPIILYIIALFVIPEEGSADGPKSYPPVNAASNYDAYSQDETGQSWPNQPTYQPAPGQPAGPTRQYGSGGSTSAPDEAVWGADGAPWEQPKATPDKTVKEGEPAPEQTSTWESTPADPGSSPTEGKGQQS